MKYVKYLSILFLLGSCTQTFYIVRHAEKENDTEEAGLSQTGIQRGVDLEKWMADKKLDTVFTSTKRRAVLTGLSVSLPESVYQIALDQSSDAAVNAFIERLKKISSTKNILIVGHTNTIPRIVFGLSAAGIEPIPENDFDNLYIITKKNGVATIEHVTYGQASP